MSGNRATRGMTLLELLVAMVILATALIGFMWGLGVSVQEVGSTKLSYIAHVTAQSMIEEMKTVPFDEVFLTYGAISGKDSFAVTYDDDGNTYTLTAPGGGNAGEIILCVDEMAIPSDFGWVSAYDLNDDGDALDIDVSAEYVILPVIVRVSWEDAVGIREIELTTILMDPKHDEEDVLKAGL